MNVGGSCHQNPDQSYIAPIFALLSPPSCLHSSYYLCRLQIILVTSGLLLSQNWMTWQIDSMQSWADSGKNLTMSFFQRVFPITLKIKFNLSTLSEDNLTSLLKLLVFLLCMSNIPFISEIYSRMLQFCYLHKRNTFQYYLKHTSACKLTFERDPGNMYLKKQSASSTMQATVLVTNLQLGLHDYICDFSHISADPTVTWNT